MLYMTQDNRIVKSEQDSVSFSFKLPRDACFTNGATYTATTLDGVNIFNIQSGFGLFLRTTISDEHSDHSYALPLSLTTGDDFAAAVAVSGSVMAVGAPGADSDKGAVVPY